MEGGHTSHCLSVLNVMSSLIKSHTLPIGYTHLSKAFSSTHCISLANSSSMTEASEHGACGATGVPHGLFLAFSGLEPEGDSVFKPESIAVGLTA